jgi:acetate kinase
MKEINGKYTKVISCHLGGSASICAIKDGKSMANSFGFSLQAGLPHSNRAGDIDVYALFYKMQLGESLEDIRYELEHKSGMLGLSGVSGDMRDIEDAALQGNKQAALAIDVFCYAVISYIGSYHVILGGLDDLVYTAWIGEKSPIVRKNVCERLGALGITINDKANTEGKGERLISGADSKVKVWVIPTNEELQVARQIFSYV